PIVPMGLDRFVHDRDLPPVHQDHAQDAFDQGGLPRSIGTEDGNDAPRANGSVQALEHVVPSQLFLSVRSLYHLDLFSRGLLSMSVSGVKTGETFSEKSMMSMNRRLSKTMVSGVRFTI